MTIATLLILICVNGVSGQRYWFTWSEWTTCTSACGTGTQSRTRETCIIEEFVYWETCFDNCTIDSTSDSEDGVKSCNRNCGGMGYPEEPDISQLKPVISMHENKQTGDSNYICNFSSVHFNSTLMYKVEWLLTSMWTRDIRLKASGFSTFTNEADFNSVMSLKESDLVACGVSQNDFTVV